MVFDADDMPRCACVFISQSGDKVALFEKLRSVCVLLRLFPKLILLEGACSGLALHDFTQSLFNSYTFSSTAPIDTIVTDCSPDWPPLLEAYFGNEAYSADFQVSWTGACAICVGGYNAHFITDSGVASVI